jgi:hypothetical protein
MKRLTLLFVLLTLVAATFAASASGAVNYFLIRDNRGVACVPGNCQLMSQHGWGDQYPFTYNGWIVTPTDGVKFEYWARQYCGGGKYWYSNHKTLSNTVDYVRRNLGTFQIQTGAGTCPQP